ncbi:TonB-dependent receptor [Portibacter marinus]|uniref:TonB-dependent receptor n=1 Tax=Portibacter marinus TaxID=2898660 RepID=UPI001F1DB0EE|nr:TonB-dependent receptor [Portibacter marinus]
MKYIALILVLFTHVLYAQDNPTSALSFLKQYTEQFNIQFAYNPEKVESLELREVNNLAELKEIFLTSNVSILEISDSRWLLKNEGIIMDDQPRYFTGRVIDADGQALVNALIYSGSGQSSVLTDNHGNFTMEVKGELDEVCCQYLGYQSQCLTTSDQLLFELTPVAFMMDGVKIETKKVNCSMRPLDDSEHLRIQNSEINQATLGKDVLRTVQLLSGVDATNDLSASLNIRATNGYQSLITLDGIPLYNTESAFSMFSVLNPLVISNAVLYKNTMPLEYGEFTGGYLECEGLSDIKEKLSLNLEVNTLQTIGSIQVPVGKSSQISAAFRRSNGRISNSQYYSTLRTRKRKDIQLSDDFERPEFVTTELGNRFGDLYLNFSHEWKGNQKFTISAVGNRDVSSTMYEGSYLWSPRNNLVFLIDEEYEQSKTKANVGLSTRYTRKFKSTAELQISYYSSIYALNDDIQSSISIRRRMQDSLNNFNSQIQNGIRDNNLKFQFISDRSKTWSWQLGTDFRRLQTDFTFRSINENPAGQNLRFPIVTPYAGLRFDHKGIIVADFGIRNAIIPANRFISFGSPRGKLLLKLNEGFYLKSSASYNQQFFRPVELERQLGQTTTVNVISNADNVPIMKSAQVTLGMNYFKEGWKFNADFFVRENTGILEQVLERPGVINQVNVFQNNTYISLQGVNHVRGIDVTSGLEKENFSGLLSYTYSKSEDRFPRLFNNDPIPDQNNRTHQINLFASYQLNSWTFSSTYIYGSGVYTLNRIALPEGVKRNQIKPSDLFRQLPAYRRFDINTSYRLPLKKGTMHFDLGIFNLLDYENINSEIFIYALEQEGKTALGASQVNLLGRIWTAGIRYQL